MKAVKKVLLTRYRKNSLGEAIVQCLESNGLECCMAPGDVNHADNAELFFGKRDAQEEHRCPADLGQYDMVINVAGRTANQPIPQHDDSTIIELFRSNVMAAMTLTKAYCNARQGQGVILHVGSIAARKVMTHCSAYCATKAALAQYVACAGWELRGRIAVLAVHPPTLSGTPMSERVARDLQAKRGMTDEQVAKIFADAMPHTDAAHFIATLALRPVSVLHGLSGENIFMGNADHR